MKVSILGNSLTSLTLAKTLVNQGIKIDILSDEKKKKYNKFQTLGISKANVVFFNKYILDITKYLWNIDHIEILSENLKNDKILNFKNKDQQLFSVIKNYDLYEYIFSNLKKNRLVKFKKELSYKDLLKKGNDLIFNCDHANLISKKFFYKKVEKNYNSFAYVTTFIHKKLFNNRIATQVFTRKGPLAFLPISSIETSVVYSVRGSKDLNLENSIKKYNTKYKILKINKASRFELKSSNLRSYYHKNIIAFGDSLHKLHPLAGQGFNMTIRDIKEINKLINLKKEHGLPLDNSICLDFEKNTKSKNQLFSSSIDLIYEFFKLDSKFFDNNLSKIVKLLGKNKIINKFFIKFADKGIRI